MTTVEGPAADPTAEERLREYAESLRPQLEADKARLAKLDEEATEVAERIARITHAMKILVNEPPPAKRKGRKPGPNPGARRRLKSGERAG